MTEIKVVQGSDLAFGIQFTMQFPDNRSLTFTTAYPQDCDDKDLRKLLSRMSDAADFLDSKYRIRALYLYLERAEFELRTIEQQIANSEVSHRKKWEDSGRKGEFKASGAQVAEIDNFQLTRKRQIEMIRKTRDEILDLEQKVNAPHSLTDLHPGNSNR
jgi:hypothetical protein